MQTVKEKTPYPQKRQHDQQTMTHQQNHVNGGRIPRNRKSPEKKKTIIEVLH